jgi:cellulase/cellobiase CelA1
VNFSTERTGSGVAEGWHSSILFYWIKQHENIWTKYKAQIRKFMSQYCVPVFHNILEYKARGLAGSAPIMTSQSLDH